MFLKSSKGGVGAWLQETAVWKRNQHLPLSLSPFQVKAAVAKTGLRERERDGTHPFSIQLPRMLEDTLFLISCGFVPSFSTERKHPTRPQHNNLFTSASNTQQKKREIEKEKADQRRKINKETSAQNRTKTTSFENKPPSLSLSCCLFLFSTTTATREGKRKEKDNPNRY